MLAKLCGQQRIARLRIAPGCHEAISNEIKHRFCSELTRKIDKSDVILMLKPTDLDGIGSTCLSNRL